MTQHHYTVKLDFLFELLFELIAEGTVELSKSKKVPKYIRYILIGIITLFFIAAIGLVFFGGLVVLKQNLFLGIIIIAVALFMLIMSIIKFKKTYLKNKK